METTVFIFNEEGFIKEDDLTKFKDRFIDESILDWKEKLIEQNTTIFSFLASNNIDFTLYNYGYVLKLEGSIIKIIIALIEIDKIINNDIEYYVSPNQRVENNNDFKYPRGGKIRQVSEFLDFLFKTEDYTDIYNSL